MLYNGEIALVRLNVIIESLERSLEEAKKQRDTRDAHTEYKELYLVDLTRKVTATHELEDLLRKRF